MQAVVSSIEGVHPANILCVKLLPGQDAVLTGSGEQAGGRGRKFEAREGGDTRPIVARPKCTLPKRTL